MDAVKILGGLLGNNATGGNVLGSILKGAAGGQQQQQPQQSGAVDLLRGLLGGGGARQPAQRSGGGLLEGLLGGGGGNDILGGLLKAAIAKKVMGAASGGGGGIGDLLGGILGGGGGNQPEPEPQYSSPQRQQANDQATILVRAMCNSAKADGHVDQSEQDAIIGRMGELDQSEVEFLRRELSAPLDVDGFVRSVPREMGPQVYALSLMTVKVDTRQEVQYLTELARGLGLDRQTVEAIHQQVGA